LPFLFEVGTEVGEVMPIKPRGRPELGDSWCGLTRQPTKRQEGEQSKP
jgi:hypothetical protein